MPYKTKESKNKRNLEYYYSHKEQISKQRKLYREKHPEKFKNNRNNFVNNLKVKYDLTVEQLNHMLIAQDNRCAICRTSFKDKRRHIDHNHITNKVRELLCCNCNQGLGQFKEDINLMKTAINYLEKWNGK